MWLLTTQGFYSVVEHRDDPDRLLVRARSRADIEALREQLPDLEPFSDDKADYRWRAVVTREDWAQALKALAGDIDYDNFKNAVSDRQSDERVRLYHEVWAILLKIQTHDD